MKDSLHDQRLHFPPYRAQWGAAILPASLHLELQSITLSYQSRGLEKKEEKKGADSRWEPAG